MKFLFLQNDQNLYFVKNFCFSKYFIVIISLLTRKLTQSIGFWYQFPILDSPLFSSTVVLNPGCALECTGELLKNSDA